MLRVSQVEHSNGSGTFTTNLWMLEGFAKTKNRFGGLLR